MTASTRTPPTAYLSFFIMLLRSFSLSLPTGTRNQYGLPPLVLTASSRDRGSISRLVALVVAIGPGCRWDGAVSSQHWSHDNCAGAAAVVDLDPTCMTLRGLSELWPFHFPWNHVGGLPFHSTLTSTGFLLPTATGGAAVPSFAGPTLRELDLTGLTGLLTASV